MAEVTMEAATPADAAEAADLAAAKRAAYEQYAPVFWRVAEDARAFHEPFLANCIANAEFTSFAARRDGRLAGIAIASHEVFPPPFGGEPQPSWLVDDFFVAFSDDWSSVGRELLRAVDEAARAGGADRLIVLTARRDEPKRQLIEEAGGYERGA